MTLITEAPSAWSSVPSGLVWRETRNPERPDWFAVGEACYAAQFLKPVFLDIAIEGLPRLLIDVWERVFWWDAELSELPLTVEISHIAAVYPHLVDLPSVPGRDIELLLWTIGNASFSTSVAPWLSTESRHRLRRWPNLTALPHTSDQLRMTSVFAQAPLTAQELAALSQTSLSEAQTIINVFSLMGLSRIVTETAGSPVSIAPDPRDAAQPAPVFRDRQRSNGLFSRLRTRFGR